MARPALSALLLASSLFANTASAQLEPGEPADGFELSRWLSDVSAATDIAFLSDGRAVVTRKGGEIWVVTADGSVQNAAARIEVDSASEKGLLGVVRDDNDNLYLYASSGDSSADKHRIFLGRVSASGEVSVDQSESLIGPGLEGPANHDGGGMVIHEGKLYVGVGDTGLNASPPANRYGACLNKPNAKILRIHLDGSIPDDNPLVGVAEVTGCSGARSDFGMFPPDERIYAWGLRNPWRLYVDPVTDLLWIGDVGEVSHEEITVGGKGANHGWPFFEGTVEHGALGGLGGCMDMVPPTPCTPPQQAYGRSDGTSVTGGLIPPAQCGWGDFEQRYFFADWGSNRVWTIDLTDDRRGAVPMSRRLFGQVSRVVSFRMGPGGALYLVSHDGFIDRIVPRQVPASCDRPAVAPMGDAATGPPDAPSAPVNAQAARGEEGCGCNLARRRAPGLSWLGVLALLTLLALRTLSSSASRSARRKPG